MMPRGGAQAPRPAPDGLAIYAVGDIHGRLDLLIELQARILADAARRRAARRVVVYLGDYVDRGPDSRSVLERLTARPLPGFDSVHLRGNHEQMMLDFADGSGRGMAWFPNGGGETLASYGLDAPAGGLRPAPDAAARLRAGLLAALPTSHDAFLRALPACHRIGDYVFVHAGIRPGVALADQSEVDMLWIREPFLGANTEHGFVVVHGHTVSLAPQIRTNRIGIDTGAYATGVLTALAIEGGRVDILRTAP
jgi:serine/threonine protein phosphatase 1